MGEQHFLGKLMGDGENYKVVGIMSREGLSSPFCTVFVKQTLIHNNSDFRFSGSSCHNWLGKK